MKKSSPNEKTSMLGVLWLYISTLLDKCGFFFFLKKKQTSTQKLEI